MPEKKEKSLLATATLVAPVSIDRPNLGDEVSVMDWLVGPQDGRLVEVKVKVVAIRLPVEGFATDSIDVLFPTAEGEQPKKWGGVEKQEAGKPMVAGRWFKAAE